MTAPAAPTPAALPTAAKPRRKRRLWLKLLVGLVVAAVVAVAAVQAVLWSDYPRQIGERVAQNVTGLRVGIGKLAIEWDGRVRLDDLAVSLPLAEKPFLTVPRVDAKVSALPLIALTLGDLGLESVTVERPVLEATQNRERVWNLQQVVAQLTTPGRNVAAGGSVQLPDVTLTDATVRVTPAGAATTEFADIDLTGRRGQPLQWTFDGRLSNLATAKGQLSTAGRWPQEASVVVKPALLKALNPLLETLAPAVANLPTISSAQIDWTGARTDRGIEGRLVVPPRTTQLYTYTLTGATLVKVEDGALTATPDGLTFTAPGLPPLTLAGGSATLVDFNRVELNGVRVRFADGTVRLSGHGDLAKRAGSVAATWEQIAYPPGVVHGGSAEFEAANVWPGKPYVKGNANLVARIAGDTLEARTLVRGDGPRWDDATYTVDVPVIRYGRQSSLSLTDARVVLHNTAESVDLVGVKLSSPAARLDARGTYAFAGANKGTGYFTAVGDGLGFGPSATPTTTFGFNVNAWAEGQTVTLQTAYAHVGTQAWANLSGQYVTGKPSPIEMQLDFDSDPELSLAVTDRLSVAGHASGSLKVGGTLMPDTRVTLDGTLNSRKLRAAGLLIGDSDLVVHGVVRGKQAQVATDHLSAFGGEGWFGADYTYFDNVVHAFMGFSDIDAEAIGKAVKFDGLRGRASGDFDVHVPMGNFAQAYGTGKIDVTRPAAPMVEASYVTVPVRLGDGYVRVLPTAEQDKGGTAKLDVWAALAEPTRLRAKAELKQWLTALPDLAEFSTLTTGRIDLPQVDAKRISASGEVALSNVFYAHNKPIGRSEIKVQAGGRQVRLERVSGDILGGVVYGSGTLDFDDLAAGELWLGLAGLNLDRLTAIDPRVVGAAGRVSVHLHTQAATGERPLGPVRADVDVRSDGAEYKGVQVGDTHVTAFVDKDRVALADDPQRPNLIGLAGGRVKLWGRLTQTPPGEDGRPARNAYVSIGLDELDTEQLNKMIDPDGREIPGRLSGEIIAFGNPADVRRLSGSGVLHIHDSNLANVQLLAVLYNAMHVFGSENNGRGDVRFTINAGRLQLTDVDYFNIGVYARAAVTVDNVLDLKDSPVSGYVIGTYRPLRDIDLPFLGTVDSILDALQTSATTLQVSGSLKKIVAVPASLKAVGGDLRNILVGGAQAK